MTTFYTYFLKTLFFFILPLDQTVVLLAVNREKQMQSKSVISFFHVLLFSKGEIFIYGVSTINYLITYQSIAKFLVLWLKIFKIPILSKTYSPPKL